MNLFSEDLDNDTLIMSAQGVGFSLGDINGLFSSNNYCNRSCSCVFR